MDVGVIWGIVFVAYVLIGIYPLMKASNGPRPQNTIPGSLKLKTWEENEKKSHRALIVWGLGFGVLLAAFTGFTQYEKKRAQENAIATAYRSTDKTTADYIAILRATAPDYQQSRPPSAEIPTVATPNYYPSASPSPLVIALVFVAVLALLATIALLILKAWKERGRLYSLLIYVFGRAYKLKRKTSARFSSFADQVKEAAEK